MADHAFSTLSFRDVGVDFVTGASTYQAVKAVSFEVRRGEVTCIIGPSGCGKSTMLNLLGGFIKPARGRIEVTDSALSVKDLRKAFIFQDYALFPWRTALENVCFGLEVLERPPAVRRELAALQAMRDVGLEAFADFYPHKLSGGMKQRVSVARALAFDPDILLMDEPFAALDEEMREELQELVLDIWQKTQKTIVYITHSIPEAVYLADRVVVFTPGPGEVRAVIDIDLPKPRDRLGDAFRDRERELVAVVRRHRATTTVA